MRVIADDLISDMSSVFDGCKIVLELDTTLRYKEKLQLKELVTKNGGVVSYILTKQCSFLLVSSKEKSESYRCQMARKYGVPVASVDFLRDCVKAGKFLDIERYLIKTQDDIHAPSDKKTEELSKSETIEKSGSDVICDASSKVWDADDQDCPKFDGKAFELAKYAVYHNNLRKFYVLEIHVNTSYEKDYARFRLYAQHYDLENHEKIQYFFSNSAERILEVFSSRCREVEHLLEWEKVDSYMKIPLDSLGTQQFRKVYREKLWNVKPSSEVLSLVSHVWEEAVGTLSNILTVPVDKIKMEQVEKAEGVLVQIKKVLLVQHINMKDLANLSSQFYEALPHFQQVPIISKLLLSQKQDLCQLIRDMVAVGETTHWQRRPPAQATYQALRCNLEYMEKTDMDYETVNKVIQDSLIKRNSMRVLNIFTVRRHVEDDVFRHDLGQKKLLFHASEFSRFLGILSRGLLLPKLVVNEYGGTRSDVGNLGYGIYFADSASTSCKYSAVSRHRGTRFLLISEVALGSSHEVYSSQPELTEPPPGCDSLHGVAGTPQRPSFFTEDEFAIYNSNQQRLRYLVEFTLPGDNLVIPPYPPPEPDTPVNELLDFSDILTDVNKVKDKDDPLSKMKSGLIGTGDLAVPLKSVHIRARLVDLAAQVVVLQAYRNDMNTSIEAKYVFPLDDLAAVCGFEAFINGKHIVGKVKEKAKAHKEYKEAISAGHGAYLMDQDEETPDVFTVSVGNLPPQCSVVIKITYVAELQTEDGHICFSLPGSVAPWKRDSSAGEKTQSVTDTMKVNTDVVQNTTLQIAVNMPFDIRSIESPTHRMRKKGTATRAVLELEKNQTLENGFQLLIGLSEIHVPRMWVEEFPDDEDSQACMLTFYPEIDTEKSHTSNITFLVDMSNSMNGKPATDAVLLLLLMLNQLDKKTQFNVAVFGTDSEEVFSSYQYPSAASIGKVEQYFKEKVMKTKGGTDLYHPLHSLLLLQPSGTPLNILLISDGHINSEELIFCDLLSKSTSLRLFTLGVSDTANRHRLRSLARIGSGSFEFFDSKLKSRWLSKVKSVLYRVSQPSLSSVSVNWHQYDNDPPPPIQAPRQIMSLFSGSRQVVYGFVPNCQMATLKAVVNGQEISTVVSSSQLSNTKGMILHRLTARALIRDWEDGMLSLERGKHEAEKVDQKDYIIELSKKHSIVTQLTSFVAVEERSKEFSIESDTQIEELLMSENVDDLDYISWERSLTVEERIFELQDDGEKARIGKSHQKANQCFHMALALAKENLSADHPTRLQLALDIAQSDGRVEVAQQALDDAVVKLDSGDSSYESKMFVKKLRDFVIENSESTVDQESVYSSTVSQAGLGFEDLDVDVLECYDDVSEELESGEDVNICMIDECLTYEEEGIFDKDDHDEEEESCDSWSSSTSSDYDYLRSSMEEKKNEGKSSSPKLLKPKEADKFCAEEQLEESDDEEMGFGLFDDDTCIYESGVSHFDKVLSKEQTSQSQPEADSLSPELRHSENKKMKRKKKKVSQSSTADGDFGKEIESSSKFYSSDYLLMSGMNEMQDMCCDSTGLQYAGEPIVQQRQQQMIESVQLTSSRPMIKEKTAQYITPEMCLISLSSLEDDEAPKPHYITVKDLPSLPARKPLSYSFKKAAKLPPPIPLADPALSSAISEVPPASRPSSKLCPLPPSPKLGTQSSPLGSGAPRPLPSKPIGPPLPPRLGGAPPALLRSLDVLSTPLKSVGHPPPLELGAAPSSLLGSLGVPPPSSSKPVGPPPPPGMGASPSIVAQALSAPITYMYGDASPPPPAPPNLPSPSTRKTRGMHRVSWRRGGGLHAATSTVRKADERVSQLQDSAELEFRGKSSPMISKSSATIVHRKVFGPGIQVPVLYGFKASARNKRTAMLTKDEIAARAKETISPADLEHTLKLQRMDGRFAFDEEFAWPIRYSKNICEEILYAAGLKSLETKRPQKGKKKKEKEMLPIRMFMDTSAAVDSVDGLDVVDTFMSIPELSSDAPPCFEGGGGTVIGDPVKLHQIVQPHSQQHSRTVALAVDASQSAPVIYASAHKTEPIILQPHSQLSFYTPSHREGGEFEPVPGFSLSERSKKQIKMSSKSRSAPQIIESKPSTGGPIPSLPGPGAPPPVPDGRLAFGRANIPPPRPAKSAMSPPPRSQPAAGGPPEAPGEARETFLNPVELEKILKLQNMDGRFEFDGQSVLPVHHSKSICKDILYSAGLKSLGEKATKEILDLVTTLITVMKILTVLSSVPFTELVSHFHLEMDLENFKTKMLDKGIRSPDPEQLYSCVVKALEFCKRTDSTYPTVYYHLELGQSWPQFITGVV